MGASQHGYWWAAVAGLVAAAAVGWMLRTFASGRR